MGKRFILLFSLLLGAVFMMGSVLPDSPYKMPLGTSKWRIGKNCIIANIDLNESLLSDIKGMREKHYNYASGSESQLQQITKELIQPYVNKTVSITLNGRTCQVQVDKLVRHDNSIYTIWLSINDISIDRPENVLRIDYRMLFEELKNNHINRALFYLSDATGDALQRVFDYTPAQGMHDFDLNSQSWELSIKGSAPAPPANPQKVAAGTNPGRETR